MDGGYPGNHPRMTNHDAANAQPDPLETAEETGDARLEAVQAVVDRVTSWQDGAEEGTVESELRRGLADAGVDLDDREVSALVEALEKPDHAVHVRDVLA